MCKEAQPARHQGQLPFATATCADNKSVAARLGDHARHSNNVLDCLIKKDDTRGWEFEDFFSLTENVQNTFSVSCGRTKTWDGRVGPLNVLKDVPLPNATRGLAFELSPTTLRA